MSIKSVREARGISQKQLADLVGVQQGAVAQWETGKTAPRFERIISIANALECTVDDLVRKESE